MPAGRGEEAQRFAAAVEQGRSPDSVDDDDLAQELRIVATLQAHGRAAGPSPDDRARAKRRLLAALEAADAADSAQTDRLGQVLVPAFPVSEDAATEAAVAELLRKVTVAPPAPPPPPPPTAPPPGRTLDVEAARPVRARRPGGRHSLPSRPAGRPADVRPQRPPHRAFSLVGSAALVLAIALAGSGMLLSRDALPGDRMYSVKLMAESAGLALTFDDMTRARRHLELASIRLDEVERLVAADPQVALQHPELVISAIREFDASAGQGARILLGTDEAAGGADARADLRSWAAAQLERLAELQPELPAAAPAGDAVALLDRVVVRTRALEVRSACGRAPESVDDLGPVPACLPAGAGSEGTAGDPADAGGGSSGGTPDRRPADDPTGSDTSTSSAPSSGGGRGSGDPDPSTEHDSSADRDDDPDPVPDTPVDDLPADRDDPATSESPASDDPAPAPDSGESSTSSDDGGTSGPPPVELPALVPALPGVSL